MSTKEVVEVNLKQLDLWSFISSISSLILAIVAIVLSILFYTMSTKSSKEIENSSNSIKTNVDRLDELFNKMYSDTFSIVKDTVYDMRQSYYVSNSDKNPSKGTEQKTKEIIEEVVEKNVTNKQMDKQQIEDLILKVMDISKKQEEGLKLQKFKEKIITTVKKNGGSMPYIKVEEMNKQDFSFFWRALEELAEEGKIHNPFEHVPEEDDLVIFRDTQIELINK